MRHLVPPIEPALALELIHLMVCKLKEHSSNQLQVTHPTSPAKQFPPIAKLLIQQFTPIVETLWCHPKLAVPALVWLVRAATAVSMVLVSQRNSFVHSFTEMLIRVSWRLVCPMTDGQALYANKALARGLAIESIRFMCHDPRLLCHLYIQFDAAPEPVALFRMIFAALEDTIQQLQESTLNGNIVVSLLSTLPAAPSAACLEPACQSKSSIQEATAVYTDSFILAHAVETLLHIVQGLQGLATTGDSENADSMVKELHHHPQALCVGMVDLAWCSILASLSKLFISSTHERDIELVLSVLSTCVEMCGAVAMATPRDAFLSAICGYALPAAVHEARVNIPSMVAMTNSKHVAALKRLIALARSVGYVLGRAWVPVLEVFEVVDMMKPEKSSLIGPTISTLKSSINELFDSSSMLWDDGVTHLIAALASLSGRASTATIPQQSQLASSFVTHAIVRVVLANMVRIDQVWSMAMEHLLKLAEVQPETKLRLLAVDSVYMIIMQCLTYSKGPAPVTAADASTAPSNTPDVTPGKPTDVHETSVKKLGQDMLLSPIQLLVGIGLADVKEQTLKGLLVMLQELGEELQEGWASLLSVLRRVALQDESPALTLLAFKSAQLICSDFMTHIPPNSFQLFLAMVGAFGVQQSEVNIALTAINLLWGISDYLCSMRPPGVNISAKASDTTQGVEHMSETLDLWMALFSQLKTLACDPRPECRSCAITTLVKIVSSHGSLLHGTGLWQHVLMDILFAIHSHACDTAKASSDQEMKCHLGTEKGMQVEMLMHHSRNTEQKQWEETVMLVLTGIARIVRTFISVLIALEGFGEQWNCMLAGVEHALLHLNAELTAAGILSAQDLILLQVNEDARTSSNDLETITPSQQGFQFPALYVDVWKVFDKAAAFYSVSEDVEKRTIQAFVDSLVESFTRVRCLMSHADTMQLLTCLCKLCRCPAVTPKSNNTLLTNVQTLIINTIAKVSPFHDNQDAWALVTSFALENLHEATANFPIEDHVGDRTQENLFLAQCSLAESALNSLHDMLETCDDPKTRSRIFDIFVLELTDLTIRLPRGLQATITKLIERQLQHGLPAYVQHPLHTDLHQQAVFWESLAGIIWALLSLHTSTAPERPGITLFSSLVKDVIPLAHSTPLSFNVSMLDAIEHGILATNRSYEWRQHCLTALFDLCREPHQPDDQACLAVTREAATRLVRMCQILLREYVQELHLAGRFPFQAESPVSGLHRCPVHAWRRSEMDFVLKSLAELQLLPGVLSLPELSLAAGVNPNHRQAHLLLLFPQLSDCLGVVDPGFQVALKDIFHSIAKSLGLEKG